MQPVAFQLGELAISWYGILVAAGFLAGLWTAARRAPLSGIPAEAVLDLGPWLILGGLVGARALFVAMFWRQEFAGQPLGALFAVWHGGLVFYGGLLGAVLSALVYLRLKRLPIWKVADVLAPSIALGSVFGRLGCFINGCCYGRPCSLPWATQYPQGYPISGTPVHPTQLYDALLNLGLFAALARLYRTKSFPGEVFGVYVLAYAVLRFSVELFRGDYPVDQHYLGHWATPGQVLSLCIGAIGVLLLCVLRRASVTSNQKPAS